MKHRIVFYSHDSFGLGHFRRSYTIASYLVRHIEDVTVLMVGGLAAAAAFESAAGIDFVKLPGVWKSDRDRYRSRHLRVSMDRLSRMRAQLIKSSVQAFDPHLLVADNVACGLEGELMPTLRYLRHRRPHTRMALTLRDVIDSPGDVVAQWRRGGVYEAIEEFYDEVWIAGVQRVFDPVAMYEFSDRMRQRSKFCGYVVRGDDRKDTETVAAEFFSSDRPRVVAACGGGGDGYALMDAYAEAAVTLAADGVDSALFLGPDMPIEQRRELRHRLLPLHERSPVFEFRRDFPSFVRSASACVCMAGYNTLAEVVSRGKAAVAVPRESPRLEQLLRAQAFEARGLLKTLRFAALTPQSLAKAVKEAIAAGPPDPVAEMDFAGLTRITRRVRKLLSGALEAER